MAAPTKPVDASGLQRAARRWAPRASAKRSPARAAAVRITQGSMGARVSQGDILISVDLVARGLNYPTSLTFDDRGRIYVAESGLPFAGAPAGGRILRLEPGGGTVPVWQDLRDPVNGLVFHEGFFYVSEGG